MAKKTLRKFTLSPKKGGGWRLTNDKTNRTQKLFKTKAIATKGGVLKGALGKEGGSVKIQKQNGRIQEERTFPRSKDPKSSPG